VTEERKFALLFAATLLCARKLIEMEPDKPNMAKHGMAVACLGASYCLPSICASRCLAQASAVVCWPCIVLFLSTA
jgi:hypothetical protein